MASIINIEQVGEACKETFDNGEILYSWFKNRVLIRSDNDEFETINLQLAPEDKHYKQVIRYSNQQEVYDTANATELVEYLITNRIFFSEQSIGENGVPFSFSKQTSNGKIFLIQKGQLNKYRIRPAILNEHAESSKTVQAVVASGLIVGQIFKASHDNINGIMLTMESAAGVVHDDFEGYANDAALQAEWVLTGTNLATVELTIVKSGSKSMKLPGTTLNDFWIDTIASTDYTEYIFNFDFYQDDTYARLKYEFFIGDGTNTKSIPLVLDNPDLWVHFDVNEGAMIDDGGTPPNMAAITELGFRVADKAVSASAYVDNLQIVPPPGEILLKLWDMGSSIPVDAVTSINDGAQYLELGDRGSNGSEVFAEIPVPILGGKRLYMVKNFVAGVALENPANTVLTKDNYYAITIHHVDTDVSVYGPDPSFLYNYYNNGYAFSAPNEGTAITKLGEFVDCMFGVFSTQDVYVNTMVKSYDAEPGIGSNESVFIEDKNMKIENILVGQFLSLQTIQAEFRDRAHWFPKGGKLEIYHNDDYTDSTSVIALLFGFVYKPGEVHG